MPHLVPDVLFPAGAAAVPDDPGRRLPAATLRALVLDGDLAPIGAGFQPIDLPTTDAIRAASIAPRVPSRLAPGLIGVAGRTAAWVWGAAPVLAEPLTVLVRRGGRMPAVDQPGAHLHGVELAADELVRLGGLLVTTPARTAIDLLREPPGRYDAALVARLLRERRIRPETLQRTLAAPGRLRGRRIARRRLQLLLTR